MLPVESVLDLLLVTLADAYQDEKSLRIAAQPGESFIADWCGGSCGMAFVRLNGMGVSTQSFPETDPAAGRSGPLAATFHVGVARCVAVQDDQGNPPSPAQQTKEARQFLADARTIRKAIACAQQASRIHLGPKNVTLGTWTPQGPLGGCAGGYWPVSVRVS